MVRADCSRRRHKSISRARERRGLKRGRRTVEVRLEVSWLGSPLMGSLEPRFTSGAILRIVHSVCERRKEKVGCRVSNGVDSRKDLGLSQADLAARVGVSRTWINAVEAGEPSVEFDLVPRFLDHLGLHLDLAKPGFLGASSLAGRSTWIPSSTSTLINDGLSARRPHHSRSWQPKLVRTAQGGSPRPAPPEPRRRRLCSSRMDVGAFHPASLRPPTSSSRRSPGLRTTT